ncbi:MAG TPA: DUF3710 domain-containing protein [Pseudonocardia sp.]|uniref:DUF3710 domain-containing protein n=1 Tax=Pseudonocardia sp. TaxID=60912 RepID=UPI002B61FA74|nr:DUF3710 domain-containing protein [Pseudonocardia sp.]HTF47727.1 DUF3710 domain-containing protein [Pseudonocardia sp.]
MFERGNDGVERAQPPARSSQQGGGPAGPYDAADPRAPAGGSALDLGALRIRLPPGAALQQEPADGGARRSVRLVVPTGVLSLSVLAAPRSGGLWPRIAEELVAKQGGLGARVHRYPGEWGQEIQASLDAEHSWFIGVDGPRWMLYGVATGTVESAGDLGAVLREVIRSATVNRGSQALPVKAALALSSPSSRPRPRDGASQPRTFRDRFTMGASPPTAKVAGGGHPGAAMASAGAGGAGPGRPGDHGPDRIAPRSGPGRSLPDSPVGAAHRPASPPPTSRSRRKVAMGLLVGVAGLLVVVSAGSMLVFGRGAERGASENGTLPNSGSSVGVPGPSAPGSPGSAPEVSTRPGGSGQSSLAPDSADGEPPSLPVQAPGDPLPALDQPADHRFTAPSSDAPRRLSPRESETTRETQARPDQASSDEPEATEGASRNRETDEEPERAPRKDVLGKLVRSVGQTLGLG